MATVTTETKTVIKSVKLEITAKEAGYLRDLCGKTRGDGYGNSLYGALDDFCIANDIGRGEVELSGDSIEWTAPKRKDKG